MSIPNFVIVFEQNARRSRLYLAMLGIIVRVHKRRQYVDPTLRRETIEIFPQPYKNIIDLNDEDFILEVRKEIYEF